MKKSLFGNQQKSMKKFGENEEFFCSYNSNYPSKPNLNDLKIEDYEGITLVTRLT